MYIRISLPRKVPLLKLPKNMVKMLVGYYYKYIYKSMFVTNVVVMGMEKMTSCAVGGTLS